MNSTMDISPNDLQEDITLDNSNWSSDMDPPKKKRVRARLDHMSQEEKQERRKEKNRQAAQSARDRKRRKLERLEIENRRLREENMRLRGVILGNSPNQSVQGSENANILPLLNQINDSGVSDVDSKSANNSTSYLADNSGKDQQTGSSDARTMTPDSTSYYASISPTPSDEHLINSIMERDNDIALVNEVQKLVSYVNCDSIGETSFGSAALINAPLPQVQGATPTESTLAVNSLGWTSVQLMLVLLISRIHHRLSGKINCCAREQTRSVETVDEMDPINCNLYDYILNTKCIDFRRAAEAIISNKNRVHQQRLIALDFVHKYLYNINRSQSQQNSHPVQKSGSLVKVQQ